MLLIGGGVVWLLDNNGTTHFTVAGILAGGLCVVGLALVLSTWFGRARGLIPLGILLLLVSVPAATIDVPITGGTGKRDYSRSRARSCCRSTSSGSDGSRSTFPTRRWSGTRPTYAPGSASARW